MESRPSLEPVLLTCDPGRSCFSQTRPGSETRKHIVAAYVTRAEQHACMENKWKPKKKQTGKGGGKGKGDNKEAKVASTHFISLENTITIIPHVAFCGHLTSPPGYPLAASYCCLKSTLLCPLPTRSTQRFPTALRIKSKCHLLACTALCGRDPVWLWRRVPSWSWLPAKFEPH